jgi:peptidoglycan/xylan/chitin deacetylase (PgdA/CDA1 family)
MRSPITAVAIALVLAFGAASVAPRSAAAAAPSPEHPRRVTIEAGRHVGLQFDAAGNVVGRKAVTLAGPASSRTTERVSIPGRAGTYLYLVDGTLAGYYLRESMVSYVAGIVGSQRYATPRAVHFPAGTVIGYRFDAGWRLAGAHVGTLDAPSSANATRVAVINGIAFYRITDGGWADSWVPRGGPMAAKRLACHTGPRADGARRVVRTVSGAGPEVALTFDLGGRLDPALSIMRYLLLNGVCTTLFPTGTAAQTDVGAEVLAMVAAYPEVFEVGSHTMNHCNLVTGENGPACPQTPPTADRIRSELTGAAPIIREAAGQRTVPYWRPPFGAYNDFVLDAAASVGYTTTVMWGIDTIDWRPVVDGGPTAAGIVAKILDNAENGSVVLMHLGGYNTRHALPMTIHRLRSEAGLQPTSLSDLLDRR